MHGVVADRVAYFKKKYTYLHPNISNLDSAHFDKRFLKIIKDSETKAVDKLFRSISGNNGSISGKILLFNFLLI